MFANPKDGYHHRYVNPVSEDPLRRLHEFCEQTTFFTKTYHTVFENVIFIKMILYQNVPYGTSRRVKVKDVCHVVHTHSLTIAKSLIAAKLLHEIGLSSGELCYTVTPNVVSEESEEEEDPLNDILASIVESSTTEATMAKLNEIATSLASGSGDVDKFLESALCVAETSARTSTSRGYVKDLRSMIDFSTIGSKLSEEIFTPKGDLVDEIVTLADVIESSSKNDEC